MAVKGCEKTFHTRLKGGQLSLREKGTGIVDGAFRKCGHEDLLSMATLKGRLVTRMIFEAYNEPTYTLRSSDDHLSHST